MSNWIKASRPIKKAQRGCSGVFSLKDYSDIVTLGLCNLSKIDSDPRLSEAAYNVLYCPAMNLVTQFKKVIVDHLKKVALRKSNRFFGNKEDVKNLNQEAELAKLVELLGQTTRSTNHSVEALEEKLKEMGITIEDAKKALFKASLDKKRATPVKPLNEYIYEYNGQKRFRDYNWQQLASSLSFLYSTFLSGGYNPKLKIRDMAFRIDVAINAVHNTTIPPVDYVSQKIQEVTGRGQPIKDIDFARSLESSALVYLQPAGPDIFRLLQTKRSGDQKGSMEADKTCIGMASEDARNLLDITRPGTIAAIEGRGGMFREFRD
jgi:hypothetical protein